MTVVINGSGTMTGLAVGGFNDNIITKNEMATGGAWAPAGTVLQVVSAETTTGTTVSSTSFTVTALSASITPTSASNKIAVFVSGAIYIDSANNDGIITVYRNGSNIGATTYGFGEVFNASSRTAAPSALTYIDSPATTSSVAYDVRIRASGGSVSFPVNGVKASVILMEIAA